MDKSHHIQAFHSLSWIICSILNVQHPTVPPANKAMTARTKNGAILPTNFQMELPLHNMKEIITIELQCKS